MLCSFEFHCSMDNFIPVECNNDPYYEQIPAKKAHVQGYEKDLPSINQNIAYGQLQRLENVEMEGNICYDYCGVQNRMGAIQPQHIPNCMEGTERKTD